MVFSCWHKSTYYFWKQRWFWRKSIKSDANVCIKKTSDLTWKKYKHSIIWRFQANGLAMQWQPPRPWRIRNGTIRLIESNRATTWFRWCLVKVLTVNHKPVVLKCREHTINTVNGVRCDSFFWCAPVIFVFIKISTTRPQLPSNVQWLRFLSCGRNLRLRGFRPHFDHADCHLLSI